MGKKGFLCLCLTVLLSFCGCRVNAAAPPALHIATRIDVHYRFSDTAITRQFTQPAKMEAILNYLRLLEYAGIPEGDPEQHIGDTCRITVQLADGSRRIYHLHANRYLSRDFRPWEKVESSQDLPALLQSLPTDK